MLTVSLFPGLVQMLIKIRNTAANSEAILEDCSATERQNADLLYESALITLFEKSECFMPEHGGKDYK